MYVPIECAVDVERETRIIVPVLARAPRPIGLLTLGGKRIDLVNAGRTRHLCVTPKRLGLGGDSAAGDRVTVSNIGETPMRITQIGPLPERSAFFVNAADCAGRTLQPRERCTIEIGLLAAGDEPLHLLVANDAGEDETICVVSPTAAASPARTAPGS